MFEKSECTTDGGTVNHRIIVQISIYSVALYAPACWHVQLMSRNTQSRADKVIIFPHSGGTLTSLEDGEDKSAHCIK